MADEPQKDVNQSQSQSAPSTDSQTQSNTAQPPTGEQTGAANGSDNGRVPYPRFHEVVEQRNQERQLREQYEGRIRELESRLPQQNSNNVDAVQQESERLARALSMKPEAAKELAVSARNIARAERGDLEARLNRYDVMAWSNALAAKHKDFAEMAPDMDRVYSSLTPADQKMVTGSAAGLEMFYGYVKAMKSDGRLQEARAQGADQAYQSKGVKQAVSSIPGTQGQSKGKLTQAAINAMSMKEYKERLPEINLAISKGEID